jgi:hypothetical protein
MTQLGGGLKRASGLLDGDSVSAHIAALVLAFRYPIGIAGLSRFFAAADIDLIVHVDAKADNTPFREAASGAGAHVLFVDDRVRVFWRGFTMVEAMMRLLTTAWARGQYDQYLFISDDSVPLVGPNKLRERLERDGDFVAARPANEDILRLRYERFFMFDSEATQVRWLPVIDREVTQDAVERFAQLGALRKRGKKPLQTIYHGSQWMALTSTSVERILASWECDHWLRGSFEFSEVPDESYFHTILSQNGVTAWRPLVYSDWSVPSPPRVFRSPDELAGIDTGGALFARKADFDSGDLQVWMDRHLR